jgi:uncharacterized protein (TIGR00730 family)
MKTIKKVCVYAASSDQLRPVFYEQTEVLAQRLAERKVTVVYGGGAVGLMGTLATTMINNGGHVIGIMPHFMKDVEWAHKEVNEFVFVGDMHERKRRFVEDVDAIIALPGGVGTLEELFEVITWKKLGLLNKPIIILNTDGFYDPMLEFLDRMVEEKFLAALHKRMWHVITDANDIMKAIENADPWIEDAIRWAADYKK